jgi:hypothetical protein
LTGSGFNQQSAIDNQQSHESARGLQPGWLTASSQATALPDVPIPFGLRLDTRKLHAAVNAQRVTRGLTWQQAADEIGVGTLTLTHLSKGGRTGFPHVMRITGWLGRPAAEFTRASAW